MWATALPPLSRRLEPELLYLVRAPIAWADGRVLHRGRRNGSIDRVRALGSRSGRRTRFCSAVISGDGDCARADHRRITRAVYELQLDGRIADLEAGGGGAPSARRRTGLIPPAVDFAMRPDASGAP